jgi:Flp pilus assembly protein TadG
MSLHRNRREKGATMMLLLTMIPLFLIPLVGLAIDGTMCFLVQAKLAGAVDGAALGAGRLLGTSANTSEIAQEFLNVNFPSAWWGTYNLTPTINYSAVNGANTISVYATVKVPLLFMRIFNMQFSTVAATGTATRAFTRVELVLDRSGSMNNVDPISGLNVCPTMISGAKNFVGMFTPGTDELGMVALGGSSLVAYPETRPYNNSPASVGGPDTSFATNSTTGPMFDMLNAMNCGGGTGSAEALALAYIELQKAHNRDFTANGADNRANNIVFFTDGVPTTLAVDLNSVPVTNVTAIKAASGCTYKAYQAPGSANVMQGWIAVSGGNVSSWGSSLGLLDLSGYDTSNSLTSWLGNGTLDEQQSKPTGNVAGCSGLQNGGFGTLTDLSRIPQYDVYSTSTDSRDNGYQGSTSVYNGTAYDSTQPTNPVHLGIAIWNATDNIGKTIRTQNGMNPIKILTIGYTGNGGTDAVLLNRLANTAISTSYVATEPNGSYHQVDNANQLGPVFAQVAGSVLRLAK